MDEFDHDVPEWFAGYATSRKSMERRPLTSPYATPYTPATGFPAPGTSVSDAMYQAYLPTSEEDQVAVPGRVTFEEGQSGVTFDNLLGPYLNGVERIEITDPKIQTPNECKIFLEFMLCVTRHFDHSVPSIACMLTTAPRDRNAERQINDLDQIAESMSHYGLSITYRIIGEAAEMEPHIRLDDTWDIYLSRGLDIYQRHNGFFYRTETAMSDMRKVFAFDVEYRRLD